MVKGEFLRISQAGGEDFQLTAIRFAAEDGSTARVKMMLALVLDVVTPITDGKVKSAVWSHDKSVRIMASKSNTHTVTVMQRNTLVSKLVTIGVFELPEMRNARQIDFAIAYEDAGCGPVGNFIKVFGVDDGLVC